MTGFQLPYAHSDSPLPKTGPQAIIGLLPRTQGFGPKATTLIKVKPRYETTDPTVDSQIIQMKSAGCDVFIAIAIPKFEAQAIRKVAEIEWKPVFITHGIAASVGAAFKPAGLGKPHPSCSAYDCTTGSRCAALPRPPVEDLVAGPERHRAVLARMRGGGVILR